MYCFVVDFKSPLEGVLYVYYVSTLNKTLNLNLAYMLSKLKYKFQQIRN